MPRLRTLRSAAMGVCLSFAAPLAGAADAGTSGVDTPSSATPAAGNETAKTTGQADAESSSNKAKPDAGAGLIGLWHTPGVRIEFRDDGTYSAHLGGRRLEGFWLVIDGRHLATWSDPRRPRRVNEFSIKGRHLLIRSPGGKTIVHTRIKAPTPPGG